MTAGSGVGVPLFLSVVTAAEIEDGIARLGDVRAGSAGANIALDAS
jgi:hypothetical protein